MSLRSFLSLCLLASVSVVAAVAAIAVQPNKAGPVVAPDTPMYPQLAARLDQVGGVQIGARFYSVDLEKQDTAWVDASRGGLTVEPQEVTKLLGSFAALTRVEPKTADPELYRYIGVGGPDAPQEARGVSIVITDNDGEVLVDAVLGRPSENIGYSRVGATFIRDSDGAQSWLAEGSVPIPSSLETWLQPLFSVAARDIQTISVSSGSDLLLTAELADASTGDYALTYLAETLARGEDLADSNGLRALLAGLVSVRIQDARARAEMATVTPTREVRFDTFGGASIVARLLNVEGTNWVTFDIEGDGAIAVGDVTVAQLREKTTQWAFRLPTPRLEALATPVERLYRQADATPTPNPPAASGGGLPIVSP